MSRVESVIFEKASEKYQSATSFNMSIKISVNVSEEDKHTNDVVALAYYAGKVYSGADDGKIKVSMMCQDCRYLLFIQNLYKIPST